MDHMLLGK